MHSSEVQPAVGHPLAPGLDSAGRCVLCAIAIVGLLTVLSACDSDLGLEGRVFACDPMVPATCPEGRKCLLTVNGLYHCVTEAQIDCQTYSSVSCDAVDSADAGDMSDLPDGTTTCDAGLRACGAACVDTSRHPDHCGRCNVRCNPGETCVEGTCKCGDEPTCAPGEVCCGGICGDSMRPECLCGGGNHCLNSQICCDGRCVDPRNDATNCGACGLACAPGAECVGTACVCGDDRCRTDITNTTAVTCETDGCNFECAADWGDCDGIQGNGCEASLDAVPNCGECDACGATAHACVDQGAGLECDPIEELAAGLLHTCVRRASGHVACWGSATVTASGSDELAPTDVGLMSTHAISAGGPDVCAIIDGPTTEIQCWGAGLGPTGATAVPEPVDLDALNGEVPSSLAVGSGSFACTVTESERVWCWGTSASDRLGFDSSLDTDRPTTAVTNAMTMTTLTGASVVTTGLAHGCATIDNGGMPDELWCWGANERGQLGTNGRGGPGAHQVRFDDDMTPFVPIDVSAGVDFTCAVGDDADVYCWGDDADDWMPLAATDDPCERTDGVIACPAPLTVCENGASAVAAGGNFACAICEDSTVECWGEIAMDESSFGCTQPKCAIAEAAGAKLIATGREHVCTRNDDGQVVCWGNNSSLQLGHSRGNTDAYVAPGSVTELP